MRDEERWVSFLRIAVPTRLGLALFVLVSFPVVVVALVLAFIVCIRRCCLPFLSSYLSFLRLFTSLASFGSSLVAMAIPDPTPEPAATTAASSPLSSVFVPSSSPHLSGRVLRDRSPRPLQMDGR